MSSRTLGLTILVSVVVLFVVVFVIFMRFARNQKPKPQAPYVTTSPTTHVSELPKLSGESTDGKQSKGPGLLASGGSFPRLAGTVAIAVGEETWQGGNAQVEVSVQTGTVRVFISDGDKGYLYAEATPGHPAGIVGTLIYWGGDYAFRLQSVDGEATGVTYRSGKAP